jgi:hypothetical protein
MQKSAIGFVSISPDKLEPKATLIFIFMKSRNKAMPAQSRGRIKKGVL